MSKKPDDYSFGRRKQPSLPRVRDVMCLSKEYYSSDSMSARVHALYQAAVSNEYRLIIQKKKGEDRGGQGSFRVLTLGVEDVDYIPWLKMYIRVFYGNLGYVSLYSYEYLAIDCCLCTSI